MAEQLTAEQLAELRTARFHLVIDSPEGTWGSVIHTFVTFVEVEGLTLVADPKHATHCLYVSNDEWLNETICDLAQEPEEDKPNLPALVLNDESGFLMLFSGAKDNNERECLGELGDTDYFWDAWEEFKNDSGIDEGE